MKFTPPFITNINEVLPHIKDNPAFIVVDKGWYTVIDYVYAHRDTFDSDYARECRGLKFRTDTGEIIGRPYHKFHNLGECPGYHNYDVNLWHPHVVLDKLDGSMVHTVRGPTDTLHLMTRMGESPQAKDAFAWLAVNGPYVSVDRLMRNNPTKTFIFEYVGPNNRIVIPYAEENLIMTGIRDIYTGAYTPYGMMAHLAAEYDIPCVEAYGNPDYVRGFSASSYMERFVTNDEEKEGAVVRFDTGAMVKMKSDIYVRKHKSKELSESFKGVVQCVIDGTLDDILGAVEPETRVRLLDYQKALLSRLEGLHEGLRHILSARKTMDQKSFALDVQANFPRITQSLLFMTRKSGDGMAELMRTVKARYNKETELDKLFEDLELPVWQL